MKLSYRVIFAVLFVLIDLVTVFIPLGSILIAIFLIWRPYRFVQFVGSVLEDWNVNIDEDDTKV